MAAKKLIVEEKPEELTPIQQYELGLFYENMADKLQMEEYRARYYSKSRDVFKLLIEMAEKHEITFGDDPEAPDEPAEADFTEEEETEQIRRPESYSDDEDGYEEDESRKETKAAEDAGYIRKALSIGNLKAARDRVRHKAYASRARTIIEAYETAAHLRDTAASAAELRYAADQFDGMEKLMKKNKLLEKHTEHDLYVKALSCSDYKEEAEKLRKQAMKLERRGRGRLFMAGAAAVAVIAALAVFSNTSSFLKLKGDAEMALGMEEKAWQAYGSAVKEMGREDLRGIYEDARKKAGMKAYGSGSFSEARDTLREAAVGGDAEADAAYADAERQWIAGIGAGKSVHFAGTDWTVLENDGSFALLLRTENIPEVPFSEDGSACTWADSSLRKWLNSDYPEEKFTPAERELLAENDLAEDRSAVSGLVNPATADRVYIFSISEFERYKDLFPEWKKDTWLRTPGEYEGMQAFAGLGNTVMPYGYHVSTKAIRVKPVIRVRLK